jgi:hypothetical protein
MNPRLFSFVGAASGYWQVNEVRAVCGESLSTEAAGLTVVPGDGTDADSTRPVWTLRGVKSNERYVTVQEKAQLVATQAPLGQPTATCAVLIPIRKSPAWWALTQEERRHIFEESSHHTRIGLQYLPAIARSLYHCRDLSSNEPFDFLTWFEFAPEDRTAFDALLAELRATPEWGYVEREVEVRLHRAELP